MKTSKLLIFKNKLPILNNILASGGYLYATNLYLISVVKAPDFIKYGLYYQNGLENESANINDFPDLTQVVESDDYFPVCTLDKLTVNHLLANASKDETRIHLCGAFVDAEKKCIVSTNGYSLFKVDIKTTFTGNNIIIPIDALKKVSTFKTVEISYSAKKNKVRLSTSEGEVYTAPINREYPRYQAIIPVKSAPYSCNISADTLSKIREAAKLDKKSRVIFDGKAVSVSSDTHGEYFTCDEIDCSSDFKTTGFNTSVLFDAIGNYKGNISLNFYGETSVCKIDFIGEQDKLAVAMPIKL